jgi:hypothetical protein
MKHIYIILKFDSIVYIILRIVNKSVIIPILIYSLQNPHRISIN